VPAKWLWEDEGNYYGAGAYGLSVFDNTYEIHLKTFPAASLRLLKRSFRMNAGLNYLIFLLLQVPQMKDIFLPLLTVNRDGLQELFLLTRRILS